MFAIAMAVLPIWSIGAQSRTRVIDLRKSAPDVRLTGAYKVAGGGDVNGDGTPDLLVSKGARGYEPSAGVTFVVFGSPDMDSLDLSNLGDHGFAIHGAKPDDGASEAAFAGDVNGDGLDDVIVGAPEADNNARLTSGSAYVVFGKVNTLPIHLAQFDANAQGPLGFRIDGPRQTAIAGQYVDGVGDMNDDGLDDVIVAAPFAGASYVVFGKSDFLPVDLRTFELGLHGDAGFMIVTPKARYDFTYSAGSAGDVNGDNVPDVAIGSPTGDRDRRGGYIVFGKRSSSAVDILNLGPKGFRIVGWGGTFAQAGDVNRDGFDDVLHNDGHMPYVIFGKKDSRTVDPSRLGKGGFAIIGRQLGIGRHLSGIGDLNGDKRPDLLIAGSVLDYRGRSGAGSVYVVFGKSGSATVRLWNLGSHGYRIVGANAGDRLGASLSSSPDISGDGVPEILVGAPGDDFPKTTAYVLYP